MGFLGKNVLFKPFTYTGDDALNFISTMTFATELFKKLALMQLITDGKLEGTVED